MTVSDLRPVELIDAPWERLRPAFGWRLSRLLGLRLGSPEKLNADGIKQMDEMIVRAYRDCCAVDGEEMARRVLAIWRDAYPNPNEHADCVQEWHRCW